MAAKDLYERLIEAWNGRDAVDFAEPFADDATMIGFDGSVAEGDEIREHLTAIFADHPTGRYVAKVRHVRAMGDDAEVLRAIVGMIPPGGTELNPDLNAHQTLIAERRGDAWRIVQFQNTPAQYHGRPELVRQHTAELEPQVHSRVQ
jgi:uncharacterized protein (TIGR02246 family)